MTTHSRTYYRVRAVVRTFVVVTPLVLGYCIGYVWM